MCWFVHAEFAAAALARVEAALAGFRLVGTAPLDGRPPAVAARLVTTGMCSCDLYARPGGEETDDDIAEGIRKKYSLPKYQKKGWTPGRIERLVADTLATRHRRAKPVSGLRADLACALARCAADGDRVSFIIYWRDPPGRFAPAAVRAADLPALAPRAAELTLYRVDPG